MIAFFLYSLISRRSHLLPNREKLKTFIRSYAIRLGNRADSPWIFYNDSIKEEYQIKERLSSTVIDNFKKSMTITLDVNIEKKIFMCF